MDMKNNFGKDNIIMPNPFRASDEACRIVANNKGVTYQIQSIAARFQTDRDFVHSIMPPCYKVPEVPMATITLGKVKSYGTQPIDLGYTYCDLAIIGFDCWYEDLPERAEYTPLVYFNQEAVIYSGREFLGEPKRFGETELFLFDDHVSASLVRFGQSIASIEADLGPDLGKQEPDITYGAHLKCCLTHQQNEMMYDPIAAVSRRISKPLHKRVGTGTLKLSGGYKDALDDIPVVGECSFEYLETLLSYVNDIPTKSWPNREDFMPFYLGTCQNYVRHI